MGCDPLNPGKKSDGTTAFTCMPDSLKHTVTLSEYLIDRHEVTNAEYRQCVSMGKCPEPSSVKSRGYTDYWTNLFYSDYPVTSVSWLSAQNYCEWRGKRLPTEAEWEKAARGAIGTRPYPWGDTFPADTTTQDDYCYYLTAKPFTASECNPNAGTSKVAEDLKGNSPYGITDMLGNVWEWVGDWYQADYYKEGTVNPTGPANAVSGNNKIIRGGGSASGLANLNISLRIPTNAIQSEVTFGFRCVDPTP